MGNEESFAAERAASSSPTSPASKIKDHDGDSISSHDDDSSSYHSSDRPAALHIVEGDVEAEPSLGDENLVPLSDKKNSEKENLHEFIDARSDADSDEHDEKDYNATQDSSMEELWGFLVHSESEEQMGEKSPAPDSSSSRRSVLDLDLTGDHSSTLDKTLLKNLGLDFDFGFGADPGKFLESSTADDAKEVSSSVMDKEVHFPLHKEDDANTEQELRTG